MSIKLSDSPSSFWLGGLTNWSFSQESTEDMAMITQVIKSIEQMVGTLAPEKKINVRLASDRTGASQWSKNKVILPSDFLWTKDTISFSHIVDLWTAMALHEAGHIAISEALEKSKQEATHEFIVLHIVEDYWMEHWIFEQFPGYEGYFQQYKQRYMANPELGDDAISNQINDFIYLLNCLDDYKSIFQQSTEAFALLKSNWKDAKASGQLETWDRIMLGKEIYKILFPNGITRELNKTTVLKASNPNGLEAAAPSNQINESNSEVASPFLLSGKVKEQQMIEYHQQYKDGKKISWASEQMIESWMKDEKGFQKQSKGNTNQTIIQTPDVDDAGIDNYQASYARVMPYVLQLKKKFEKANTPRLYESVRLQQGSLDEDALYRAAYSTDLFKIEEERFDYMDQWDLTLLIDQSQSTGGFYSEEHCSLLKRFEVATDLAVLFTKAFEQIKLIELYIYAFSTANSSSTLQLDELYSPRLKKVERLGMIQPKFATPEYLAIKEATLKLSEEGRSDAKKLILVLSDGLPDDYQYGGGDEHRNRIKDWIKKWSHKGYFFVHIALADGTNGKEIYPISINFNNDYHQLISEVYKWTSKMILKKW